jgi:hypothetical protein
VQLINALYLVRDHLMPSVGLLFRLIGRTLYPRKSGLGRLTLKRVGIMLIFLPVFVVVQAIQWLGLLLDELFFRGYRDIVIREPLFVVGVPRSGTTLLHRTLAEDRSQFTTFTTWEVLFAVSITARRFWHGLAKLDRLLGGPLARLVGYIQRVTFRPFKGIHDVSLTVPEEDYLALLPILACFILVIPFPFSEALWRLSRFDQDMSPSDKDRILAFYRLCIQKHLYVHGPDKRFLSKNASFSSLVNALSDAFADGRIVCCLRDPRAAVPSLLSSIGPGIRLFDSDNEQHLFRDQIVRMMQAYYAHLLEFSAASEERCVLVLMEDLKANLRQTVESLYRQLKLPLEPAYSARLNELENEAYHFRSRSRYTLDEFGLDESRVRDRFCVFYEWHHHRIYAAKRAQQ